MLVNSSAISILTVLRSDDESEREKPQQDNANDEAHEADAEEDFW